MSTLGNGVVDYNAANAAAKKKMVQNQLKINTDPNYVANEQQRALKVIAQRQSQGFDVSGQQKYLNKQLGYKPPVATASVSPERTTTTTPKTTQTATPTAAPKSNAQKGSEYMAQMAEIANRTVNPFSYDPNSDPAYQSALQRARSNIDAGNAQNQAEMNRRGILNSTITSDRGSEIASQVMGNVETTVLPQLMQQAYQRYMDQENMKQQQFNNYGALADTYIKEDQRSIDNTNARADRTGYLPGGDEAQNLVNQLMGLKQQAESPGITAAERTKLSNQANGVRAMLSQMGVDISKYGADTNSSIASQATPMIRTLQGQALDDQRAQQAWENRFNYGQAIGTFGNGQQTLAAQNQAFNQGMATRQQNFTEGQQSWQNNFQAEQFAYQKARDSISDSQWQAKFDEDVRQYGLNYGLQQLSQQNDQAYREATLGIQQDENARAWLEYGDSQTPQAPKYDGMTANQVLDSVRNRFLDTNTNKLPSDSQSKDKMYQQVMSAGLPDGQDTQVLAMLGLTSAEIAAFDKKHGVISGN